MRKKVLTLAISAILINSAFAMSSATYIDPLTKGRAFQYTEVFSKHDYYIGNESSTKQTVNVCYVTTACPEYPSNTQTIRECDQYTIDPGKLVQKTKIQDLKAVYKFQGYCNVTTSTEITGWEYQMSSASGKMQITP